MPVKFEIFRDGQRVSQFQPIAAYAVGPESVPIAADIAPRDGTLIVSRPDDVPGGLSLLWEAGVAGEYHLEPTRLQPRERPYVLNVELARARLMKIVQKQEDWNLFDFPRAEKFTTRFREAQGLFAEALGKLDSPAEASVLADRSLEMSVDLSEQLAEFHCDLLLNRRRQTNAFARHIFGCRVDSSIQNQKYKDILCENFDYAVLPMPWKQLQPEEETFITEPVDDWVELLSKRRLPIIAGPLINLSDAQVPDWMFIWEHDFDTLRELAYEYVQRVVHRYRKAVAVWNVCSGLHAASHFNLSFEQIIELTRLLVAHVKNMLPQARTLITVTNPFGEYHARPTASVPPMLYAEMCAQSGVNFEAFGLELEMGVPSPGHYTRDMFQVSGMLDKFSTIGRPVFLTACGAPDRAVADPSDKSEGKLD